MLKLSSAIIFILSIFTHVSCFAETNNFTVRGYVSQGYINTAGNNYLGDNRDGSFDFGEAGLNLYFRPINRIYFSTQLISRNIGDYESGEDDLKLDYGLIGFNLISNNSYDINARFGRFKYSYGLLNDIQDISVATPGILAPQVMYFDYILNTLSLDGIQIEQNLRFNDIGSFRFDFMYGKNPDETKRERDAINQFIEDTKPYSDGATGEISSYDGTGSARLMYFSPDNSLLLGYSRTFNDGTLLINVDCPYYSYNNIVDGNTDTFSVEYVADKWTITSEYHSIFTSNKVTTIIPSLNYYDYFDGEIRSEAYYLQVTYQLRHDFEAMLRYEAYFMDKSDTNGSKWANSVGNQSINYYRYSKDWIVGAKYDINDNFILKSEFHIIDGAALNYAAGNIGSSDNEIGDGYDRYWNMFIVELTYSF